MSEQTDIGFADSTVNPLVGCDGCPLWVPTKPTKEQHCYAALQVERRGYRADGSKVNGWPQRFNEPEYYPHRMEQALKWKDLTGTERKDKPWLNGMPRIIFVNDLGDTFTPSAPTLPGPDAFWLNHWLAVWLRRMKESPHIWLIFTKQAKRMRQFFDCMDCPPNVWLVVSAIDQAMADRNIPELLATKCTVRGVSAEPLLSPITFHCAHGFCQCDTPKLSLCIVGGESGPNRRDCGVDAIVSVARQCGVAGVPVFVKQASAFKPGTQGSIPDEIWKLKEFPTTPR
jgi:protein gp37